MLPAVKSVSEFSSYKFSVTSVKTNLKQGGIDINWFYKEKVISNSATWSALKDKNKSLFYIKMLEAFVFGSCFARLFTTRS